MPIVLLLGDSTASWAGSGTSIRQSNGGATNTLAIFSGLPEERVKLRFSQRMGHTTGEDDTTHMAIGIGVNSTSAFSGLRGDSGPWRVSTGNTDNEIWGSTAVATHEVVPTIGINNINALEQVVDAGGTNTFYGTVEFMLLTAEWMG
jgi:hypothetical protein